jgi:hypothetical protein
MKWACHKKLAVIGMFVSNKMKKTILISGIVVVVILLGVVGWALLSHKISLPNKTNQPSSPFGVTPGDVAPTTGASNATQQPSVVGSGQSAPTASLFQVATDPVAGAGAFLRGSNEIIRYVDRATGHIYEVDPVAFTKTEIANNTLPKIYKALWKPDGSVVVEQTLPNDGDIVVTTSIALSAPKSTSTDPNYTLTATQLRGSASSLVGTNNSIAYVLQDTGTIGFSGYAGQKPTTLYSSAFNNWQLAWQGTNLVLTTNASVDADGFSYLLSPSSRLTKLLGPLKALTSLVSPDGTKVAYSYKDEDGSTFAVKVLKSGNTNTLVPATLSEKCVWSVKQKSVIYCATPNNGIGENDPDAWYQGITHFSDNIWKFDIDKGTNNLIAEPKKNFNVDLDIINPQLSPNEDYLMFQNKTDLSLWALKLQ